MSMLYLSGQASISRKGHTCLGSLDMVHKGLLDMVGRLCCSAVCVSNRPKEGVSTSANRQLRGDCVGLAEHIAPSLKFIKQINHSFSLEEKWIRR